jgi:hypothetical protein
MTLPAGDITAATQCYVARGDILNEKSLLTFSLAKPR